MYALKTYDQTGIYDPTNPDQRIRELYAADPGRWASYYWNQVPTTSEMKGLGGGWSSLGSTAQLAIVGIAGLAAGFFGWKKFGAKLSPTLKKVPIVGGMLSGPKRRRR
mgnify:CR=1 FL=1